MRNSTAYAAVVSLFATVFASMGPAADEFEQAPILYRSSTPDNVITELQSRLSKDPSLLTHDPEFGYLPSMLKALNVPVESQMLVFSKTSLQLRRIAPRTPRALYFNDDVYIGYCQNGDIMEVSVADPQLGAVFYSLEQEPTEQPKFKRAVDNCLICHSSSRTEGVPGHLARSLFVDAGGQPMYSAGSRVVDHTTPFKDRWGGWYVTGTHGDQTHLGNLVVKTREVPEPVKNPEGQNVRQLNDRFNVDKYLTPYSDIVALMIMEHQTLVHNRLTKANFATRQALHYEATMNKALGYDEGTPLDSTARRIKSAGDDLVEALLLVDETPLTGPVAGTSGFAKKFASVGPYDSEGRSLRDLDFRTRMFKYPCSYLVYSAQFDGLPARMKEYVWQRMWDVLSGEDTSEEFAHLTEQDCQAIVEILRDTKPELPEYWSNSPKAAVSSVDDASQRPAGKS